MIHVFADQAHAGSLEKEARKPYFVFTYHPEADLDQSVSLTKLLSRASPRIYPWGGSVCLFA
ncbi:MAG: hypothetical protein ACLFQG_07370 [Desulfovermiculus sp.]